HCIGATTLDEYKKHIEKDAALERRFQPVPVDQPTVEDTISILRGLKERDEITRRILQLEIEREALKKETDAASRERLQKLETELSGLQAQAQTMREQWEQEKAAIERPRQLRQRIEEVKVEIEKATRAYDLNRVAELQYGTLAGLERELKEEEERAQTAGGRRLLKEEVD